MAARKNLTGANTKNVIKKGTTRNSTTKTSDATKEDVKLEEGTEEILEPTDIPSFFKYVKSVIHTTSSEQLKKACETCEALIKKCEILDQTEMAKEAMCRLQLFKREIELKETYGLDSYITADDIFSFLDKYSKEGGSNLKICEIREYMREIPDDVVEKWSKVKNVFDKGYIIFTDYPAENRKDTATGKAVKKVKKEKDPVMLGALKIDTAVSSMSGNLCERMYFIADWVDEYCDLTFDKLIEKMSEVGMKDAVKKTPDDIGTNKNDYIRPL